MLIERLVPNFQVASFGSSSETVVLVDMVQSILLSTAD